jgi:hypothetical protein
VLYRTNNTLRRTPRIEAYLLMASPTLYEAANGAAKTSAWSMGGLTKDVDWDIISSYGGLLALAVFAIYAGSHGSLPVCVSSSLSFSLLYFQLVRHSGSFRSFSLLRASEGAYSKLPCLHFPYNFRRETCAFKFTQAQWARNFAC